jgi:hypothetical protein
MSEQVPELRIVATHREPCPANPEKLHHMVVLLTDGAKVKAAEVIKAIEAHTAHYIIHPPEGAPAYEAHQRTGLPLVVQVIECPDCCEKVLFA